MPRSQTLAVAGVVLSLYALYVEHKTAHPADDIEFTALCDIESLGASCSAVFQLPEGHLMSYLGIVPKDSLLDVPNAALGVLYYLYQLVGRYIFPYPLTAFAACAAMSSSVFLAYHLTLIQELCILCWTTHVLNTFLLYDTLVKLPKKLKEESGAASSSSTKVKKA